MKSIIAVLVGVVIVLNPSFILANEERLDVDVTPLRSVGLISVGEQEKAQALRLEHKIEEHRVYVESFLNGFHFSEGKVGTLHQDGEGHIRLYIDDEHVETLYDGAFIIDGLPKGEHEIKVMIVKNDRSAYGIEETIIVTI